jgi:hypothetical protein
MFCSSCGQLISEGLSYCNRCGADLKPPQFPIVISRPRGMGLIIGFGFFVTAGIALGGLSLALVIATQLARIGFPVEAAATLTIVAMGLVFGSVVMVGRQLTTLVKSYVSTPSVNPQPQLSGRPQAVLPPPRIPVPSVIEHTTRTLDQVGRDQGRRN